MADYSRRASTYICGSRGPKLRLSALDVVESSAKRLPTMPQQPRQGEQSRATCAATGGLPEEPIARVCCHPLAAMAVGVTPLAKVITSGLDLLSVVPSPSSPFALYPQA